jgi:glycosyltransferase involved in cell wall biosynthesis
MRIVVAHDAVDNDGGVETYLLSTIAELRSRGHQVALVYHRRASRHSLLLSSAHTAIGIEERGLDGALAYVRSWKPDVCYSHNMGPLAVDRAMLAGWPVVKMLHGFSGTCISGLKMQAWPSPHACSRTCGPACLAVYVPGRCGQLSPVKMIAGYRWASQQRGLFPRYTSIVVASRFMREEFSRHGAPPDRIRVVPLFSTMGRPPSNASGDAETVLFAGRMTALKGGDILIRAIAGANRMLARPLKLVMAGDGPQKREWQALAASLGVDVEMTGWLSVGDRATVYGRGRLLAVPSLWPEPFGLVGLDAASLGVPAVAFDVGGVREWLDDGVSGRLVDPAAGASGFAQAIAGLFAQPGELERMGLAALETARRMTVAAHVEALERVLQEATA